LESVWELAWNKIPQIIATLWQNYLLNGGKRASPLTPPCSFRELPTLAIIGNWNGIKIPRIIAAL